MYDLNSLGAVSYAGLDLICVFIILSVGILRRYYLKGISTGAEWVIYTLSVCYSVNLICDAAWALGESSGAMSAPAFYAANSIYFITLIAGSACWFVYSMGALGRKWIQRRPLLILLALPSLAVVYLAVTAQSNGLLFYLSDAGKYERGSLFPLFAVINYGYLVVSALAGLAAAFHRKRGAVIFLATIPVLGIALLHVVLHVNYASIGFMLMLFVMFWGEMMRFSAAHSEQQRSLTRMSESLSQQEKQAILREQTARILAADYDSVFVVNSHAHTLTTLRLTAEYDSLVERLPEEQDFYKRVEDGIRRNIHPEDRDFVARQLAPANVETRLRLQQSFSLVYRTVKDGKSYYNRMKLARGDDPDYFVVGIKNIDPEITKEIESEKQRNTLEMMKVFYGLAEDFACVLQIDTDNGADTLYTITVDLGLPGDFWPASMPYADRMELIKDEFVAPEDRLGFSNATRLENVKIQLDRYKTYYYNFHMIIRGMAQNWQVKYIRSETEPAGLVCGFRNTDREVNIIEQNRRLEKETVRQNDFFNLFAADYVSAFYINLDDGTFTAYKIQPQLEGVLSISDFEAAMGAYIGNVVYEQDRPYMLEVCKRENIKKQLEKADGFSAVFRETLSGQVTYHRLRVKRGSDRLHAAAAFMDVNDEFEREAREKERLERLVEERTSALRSQSEALKRMSTGIVDLLEIILSMEKPLTDQPLLELVWAIIFTGIGQAMIFYADGSSGGTDILALILKKHTSMDVGKAMLLVDILISAASFFAYGIKTGLYSVLGLFCMTFLIDIALESFSSCKYFVIITDKPQEITDFILTEMDHGATLVKGEGVYTHNEKAMLHTVCRRREAIRLQKHIKRIDPQAFTIITTSSEIIGSGFREG